MSSGHAVVTSAMVSGLPMMSAMKLGRNGCERSGGGRDGRGGDGGGGVYS